ncbi:MAG: ribosome recycling factor [Alphaproteobacteria bacterium]
MALPELQKHMDGALKRLQTEFSGLRTGRASPTMLDNVQVEAYGTMMHMNQVGNVTVPEPRLLSVSVWDKTMVKSVEKAIREYDASFNPSVDGQTIRVAIPAPSEDRRKEMVKTAHKYGESAKVAIRNVRRDGMDAVKASKVSEDEQRTQSDQIQKLTDDYVKKVDELLAAKEKDIMSV